MSLRTKVLVAVLIALAGLSLVGRRWLRGTMETAASAEVEPLPDGAVAGQEWDGNSLKMKFCWCPPGAFQMGEAPNQVDVTLTNGFWMGKYEVTQAEYRQVTKRAPSQFSAAGPRESVSEFDEDRLPVERVSWVGADEFCRRLTELELELDRLPKGWEYRLPTEAQWEYACRAGTQTTYCCGDTETALAGFAWYGANADFRTHEVGQKQGNAWGLHDVHGNVREWCQDWLVPRLPGGVDPVIERVSTSRIIRGGGWRSYFGKCSSGHRDRLNPTLSIGTIGFRVAAVRVSE